MSKETTTIDDLLTRGVEHVYPSLAEVKAALLAEKKLRIYFGIDPTGKLHLGHVVCLLKLRQFQDLGHEVIVLYGGFTAQIGDPTDKLATRQPLTPLQIKKNAAGYRKLIGKILDLKKANVRFLNNEKWTNQLKPIDLLQLAAQFTVSRLLERDMFQERIRQGKEIHLHEFLYPIFQAYDAVTMDVDVQIGGNDQTFNMLAGRNLMRKLNSKEMFVLATKLLVDPSGKKMGKTEGNMVNLDDEPADMYGKVMSWPDSLLPLAFELCTRLPLDETAALIARDPKQAKMRLAREIATLGHGAAKAKTAEAAFIRAFQERALPPTMPEVAVRQGTALVEALLKAGAVKSKSEYRRLVATGAIHDWGNHQTIIDPLLLVTHGYNLKIGKKRFLKITLA